MNAGHCRAQTPLRGLLAALLALLPPAACSPGAPEGVLRALDRAADGRFVPGPAGPTRVLAQPNAAAWRAARWEGTTVHAGLAPPGAIRPDEGSLALGPAPGAWVRSVPVQGGETVLFEARVSTQGQGWGEQATIRIGLMEFDAPPSDADLAAFRTQARTGAWSEPLTDLAAGRPVRVLARLQPQTRAVTLICLLAGEGPGRVRFDRPRLRGATPADRLAAILPGWREAAGAPVDRFAVEWVTRPAFCLGAGDAAVLPLSMPPGAVRFQAFLACVPAARDPLPPPEGKALELICGLRTGDGEPWLVLHRGVLRVQPDAEARWLAVDVPMPAGVPDGPLELVLRARAVPSDVGKPPPLPLQAPMALIATPRFVPATPPRRGPNLLLISIDTLRADHLGCYGYEREVSPNLDALAQDAWLFEQVWTTCPYTLPSHMSLLTGQLPSVHGVHRPRLRLDPVRSRLLAERLYESGYATGAFTGGTFLDPSFGFAAGFERYGVVDPLSNEESPLARRVRSRRLPGLATERLGEHGLQAVRSWLEIHRAEPFFLFVHSYAVHQFDPPKRHREALGIQGNLSGDPVSQALLARGGLDPDLSRMPRLIDLYDGGVRWADEGTGQLLGFLRELDLLDDTLVVVTSDHGKEIGDHGRVEHGQRLYEELLRVPLLLRLPAPASPEQRRQRRGEPVALVDVVPTVLEVLGLPSAAGLQGRSLLAAPTARPLYAEVDNLAVKYAVRRGDIKTIFSPLDAVALLPNTVQEESFDLAADPGERSPLAPDAARVEALRRDLAALRELARSLSGGTRRDVPLDDELREQLRAMGYVEEARR